MDETDSKTRTPRDGGFNRKIAPDTAKVPWFLASAVPKRHVAGELYLDKLPEA